MNDQDATLDKITYMLDRLGGDDEVSVDDLESMINKVFVASFEYEYGFEANLIEALVDARNNIFEHENEDDDTPESLSGNAAEQWYRECQVKMYKQAGYAEDYAEESTMWPDALPLNAAWPRELLQRLARKEVAHHFVVLDQIRREMAKHKEVPNEQ